MRPTFGEEWYPEVQLVALTRLLKEVLAAQVVGQIVEIGCWEGRSTLALTRVLKRTAKVLHAVDDWREAPGDRDVFGRFIQNIGAHRHWIEVHRMSGEEYLAGLVEPIAFCHIDADHTHRGTLDLIEAALVLLAPGGIICGDDFANAHAGRADLGGGVERAVREAFGDHFALAEAAPNLWWARG